jgi:hypothetical protein
VVDAPGEAERGVVGPADVEGVGILEAGRISVGGAEHRQHGVAGGHDGAIGQRGVDEGAATVELHRRVVAQDLLDRGGYE